MDTARVLVVCAGNIRRSPAVAALLTQGTGSFAGLDASVVVESAGVEALVGQAMDPCVAAELTRRGLSVSHHVARALTPEQIAAADLVVTADRSQRAAVARMLPAAVRRTFTVIEFAGLMAAVAPDELGQGDASDAERLREAVRRAPFERGRRIPAMAGDDLADLRRSTSRAGARLVRDAVRAVDDLLRVVAPRPVTRVEVADRSSAPALDRALVAWRRSPASADTRP